MKTVNRDNQVNMVLGWSVASLLALSSLVYAAPNYNSQRPIDVFDGNALGVHSNSNTLRTHAISLDGDQSQRADTSSGRYSNQDDSQLSSFDLLQKPSKTSFTVTEDGGRGGSRTSGYHATGSDSSLADLEPGLDANSRVVSSHSSHSSHSSSRTYGTAGLGTAGLGTAGLGTSQPALDLHSASGRTHSGRYGTGHHSADAFESSGTRTQGSRGYGSSLTNIEPGFEPGSRVVGSHSSTRTQSSRVYNTGGEPLLVVPVRTHGTTQEQSQLATLEDFRTSRGHDSTSGTSQAVVDPWYEPETVSSTGRTHSGRYGQNQGSTLVNVQSSRTQATGGYRTPGKVTTFTDAQPVEDGSQVNYESSRTQITGGYRTPGKVVTFTEVQPEVDGSSRVVSSHSSTRTHSSSSGYVTPGKVIALTDTQPGVDGSHVNYDPSRTPSTGVYVNPGKVTSLTDTQPGVSGSRVNYESSRTQTTGGYRTPGKVVTFTEVQPEVDGSQVNYESSRTQTTGGYRTPGKVISLTDTQPGVSGSHVNYESSRTQITGGYRTPGKVISQTDTQPGVSGSHVNYESSRSQTTGGYRTPGKVVTFTEVQPEVDGSSRVVSSHSSRTHSSRGYVTPGQDAALADINSQSRTLGSQSTGRTSTQFGTSGSSQTIVDPYIDPSFVRPSYGSSRNTDLSQASSYDALQSPRSQVYESSSTRTQGSRGYGSSLNNLEPGFESSSGAIGSHSSTRTQGSRGYGSSLNNLEPGFEPSSGAVGSHSSTRTQSSRVYNTGVEPHTLASGRGHGAIQEQQRATLEDFQTSHGSVHGQLDTGFAPRTDLLLDDLVARMRANQGTVGVDGKTYSTFETRQWSSSNDNGRCRSQGSRTKEVNNNGVITRETVADPDNVNC